MATIAATGPVLSDDKTFTVTWEGFTTNGDVGAAVKVGRFADKTVHSDGAYGTGGNIVIEGSNNNVAWFPLSDHVGTAIDALNADTVGALIAENPLWIRPRLSAGTGTIDIDVILTGAVRGV